MYGIAEKYAKALDALSGNPVLEDLRDGLLDKINKQDMKAIVKHLLHIESHRTAPFTPTAEQSTPIAEGLTTSQTSLVRAGGKTHTKYSHNLPNTSVHIDRPHSLRKSPEVRIPVRRAERAHKTKRRVRISPTIKGQNLLYRHDLLSSDDSETEHEEPEEDDMADEMSMDELTMDTPRQVPRRVTATALVSAPARTGELQHIDWVFWIAREGEDAHWMPLSAFPRTTIASLKTKFNTDYLTKPYHVQHYAQMLRNREKYVKRDRCVGNVTYTNRNTPCEWKKVGNDKQKTCDTCFNRGRLCARLVSTASGIRLGFYPLPQSSRLRSTWGDLQYWFRNSHNG